MAKPFKTRLQNIERTLSPKKEPRISFGAAVGFARIVLDCTLYPRTPTATEILEEAKRFARLPHKAGHVELSPRLTEKLSRVYGDLDATDCEP
ncbi:MAG: hypothetical protein WAW37_14215 [Syntrophobacteraceae bacterium]